MAKEKSQSEFISQDSIAYLEEVKKGKPRKFAMICKGTGVVSLVIYKKGNVEKRRKEAKEAGKGQFYHGMIDGKGVNIRFVLARADGFESEPVKTTSLKGFLADEADFACKPYFEIVDTPPTVLDDEDPLVIRFLGMQTAALQACDAYPDKASEINALCREIGGLLENEEAQTATTKIDSLANLLSELAPNASSSSPPAQPTPSAQPATPVQPTPSQPTDTGTNNPELETKLAEALKKLKPLLDQAIELSPNNKQALVGEIVTIRDQIKNQQYAQAQTAIVSLAKKLKELTSGAAGSVSNETPQSNTADPATTYQSRLSELMPIYEQVLQANVGDTSKFRSVMAFIVEQGNAAGYAKALVAIDKLSAAVKEALKSIPTGAAQSEAPQPSPTQPSPTQSDNVDPDEDLDDLPSGVISIRALSKARIELESLHRNATSAIGTVRQLVQDAYADDEDQTAELSQACNTLDQLLTKFRIDMIGQLDAVLVAENDARPQLAAIAKKSIETFSDFLEADPVANALDGNEFEPDAYVIEPLKNKLDELVDILS